MFDTEFYPTPLPLIKKMLEPYEFKRREHFRGGDYTIDSYNFKGKIFVDPQAGKGDILKFLSGDYVTKAKTDEYGNNRDKTSEEIISARHLYCFEIQPDLQAILRDNDFQLLGSNFLDYKSDMYFDYIFMNPPFSNGDEHLLHAIEIASQTDIVCILNAETIRNPHTQRRQQLALAIEKWGGTVEYHQEEFKNAERKTNVEIALVRISVKKESTKFDFTFTEDQSIDVDLSDIGTNEIAREDMIGNLIHIYEKSREAYIELMKAEDKFQYYANHISQNMGYDDRRDDAYLLKDGSFQDRYQHLSQKMKQTMWKMVIGHLNMERFMSSKVTKNFGQFVNQQSKMAFTKENTQEFFMMIMNNRTNILDEAIVDVFDALTSHTHENRNAVEGWKTNDAWKINRKVIMPDGCKMSYYGHEAKDYGTKFRSGYSDGVYSDLDKVLCYISGKNHDSKTFQSIHGILDWKFNQIGKIKPGDKFDNKCMSTFFNIKFWKKGTVHLEFRDESLWKEFNMRACAGKMWLPETEEKAWRKSKEPEPKAEEGSNQLLLM